MDIRLGDLSCIDVAGEVSMLCVLGDEGGYMDEGGGVNEKFIRLFTEEGFELDKFDHAQLTGANMWTRL